MIPPPKPPVRNLSLVVHCKKCGHGKTLASGFNASAINMSKRHEMMSYVGWQTAPEYRCPSCASPMDADEVVEALRVRALKKPGEINFALHGFRDKMMKKYNDKPLRVDNYFKRMAGINPKIKSQE